MGGLPAGGFAAAAPDKRSSLRQLLSGRGEAGEQLHASGGSQRQGRMPSLASAPASQEASTGAQQLEAPPMGPLAQAGLPALPSPPLGEGICGAGGLAGPGAAAAALGRAAPALGQVRSSGLVLVLSSFLEAVDPAQRSSLTV